MLCVSNTVHPCGGRSLQVPVQLIAIVNLIWTGMLIIAEIVLVYQYGLHGIRSLNPELSNDGIGVETMSCTYHIYFKYSCRPIDDVRESSGSVFSNISADIFISLAWISSWVIDVGFSVLLYNAAQNGHRGRCRLWFYFRLWILIVRLAFLGVYVFIGLSLVTKIPVIILFGFRIYSLWVVNNFIDELTLAKKIRPPDGDVSKNPAGNDGDIFQIKELTEKIPTKNLHAQMDTLAARSRGTLVPFNMGLKV